MAWALLNLMPLAALDAQGLSLVAVQPESTSEALLNPGMGLYVMVGAREQPDPDLWFMGLCGVAYTRCHWSDLEPERGDYRFDEYLGPMFDYWVTKLGKRVAFRVMCESMHGNTQYVTPKWVFDSGVPGVKHVGLRGQEQIDPVFWDPLYLDLHCEFLRALGQWAEGREGLEFVDIGSIGEWGEMHFGQHIPGRWTEAEMLANGFSEYRLALAYRRVIDAFAEAFPHTRVFLNVGSRLGLNDYAAQRGMHFRQDGLGPSGASYNVERTLYPEYGLRGVQCNLELIVGYDEMEDQGWDPRVVLRKGLESPLSYQNINFGGVGFLAKAPPDVREAIEECARRIGYRFALTEVRVPAEVHAWPDRPGRLPISQTWLNQGVAPCYENLAFEWALVSPEGRAVATAQDFPETPTRRWLPDAPIAVSAVLTLPQGLPPGPYALTTRAFLPENPAARYYLPLVPAAGAGAYRVCEVNLVPADDVAPQVWHWDFEEGRAAASAAQGVGAETVADPVHGGAGALRLRGHSEQSWGYATIERVSVLPAARYRLSAWVLVRAISRPEFRPTLKVGLNAADGKWITNANTQPYDTSRLDTWQLLTVEFDCPANAATGDVTVERSAFEAAIEAEVYVDEVELLTLAAP
jgi:hypothetical protein